MKGSENAVLIRLNIGRASLRLIPLHSAPRLIKGDSFSSTHPRKWKDLVRSAFLFLLAYEGCAPKQSSNFFQAALYVPSFFEVPFHAACPLVLARLMGPGNPGVPTFLDVQTKFPVVKVKSVPLILRFGWNNGCP